MTTLRDFKTYHFSSPAHWRTGLLAALTVSDKGGLAPERPLSPVPVRIEAAEQAIEMLAIDPYGVAYWVTKDGHLHGWGANSHGCPSTLEASAGLVGSPRLVFGKTWVWAFQKDTSCLLRYDATTLQLDGEITIGRDDPSGEAILDIAADGRDGVWILASHGLHHVDKSGSCDAFTPIQAEISIYRQLVSLPEVRRLALLSQDGKAITLLEAVSITSRPSESLQQSISPSTTIHFTGEVPGFSASHLDSDHRRRLLVVGTAPTQEAAVTSTVLVMDSSAALIQRIDGDSLSDGSNHRCFKYATALNDTAMLATATRLFWFRFEAAPYRKHAVGTYLTPVLHSPDNESLRGWLRAEISAMLPKGSLMTATVLSTDDAGVRDRVTMIATTPTLSPRQRQEQIKKLLATDAIVEFQFSGIDNDAKDAVMYPVPLFDRADRWLWLMIELTAGSEGDLPQLRDLRVIYPDISLTQHLPAIFRSDVGGRDPKAGDPSGFFRKLVGILETTTQGLDETIAVLGQLIHPATAPSEWMDFVARWFDLPWDDALPESAKRRILGKASVLLATRGTRAGLSLLLELLLPKATVRIVDVNVDLGLAVLGGADCVGASLPAVLTGLADDAAVLSRKTILGQARLGSDTSDPVGVMPFTGMLRIDIAASDQEKKDIEPMLEAMVLAAIPVGLRLRISWLPAMFGRSGQTLNRNFVLDNPSPRRLGQDPRLGLLVLGGNRYTRLTEAGLEVGFQIK